MQTPGHPIEFRGQWSDRRSYDMLHRFASLPPRLDAVWARRSAPHIPAELRWPQFAVLHKVFAPRRKRLALQLNTERRPIAGRNRSSTLRYAGLLV